MKNEADTRPGPKIKRRDFLSSGALRVAAALAPSALLGQQLSSTSDAAERIRVGIVAAGGIVASRHIPGLRRMTGVAIVAAANRSLESSQRAATEFDIPRAYASGEQLIKI